MNEKRWTKNAPNLIVINSIFAAIAGVLIIFVLQDLQSDCYQYFNWHFKLPPLPLFPLLFSFFLFALTAERIAEAVEEKNTDEYVAYFPPYNFAVFLLFWGINWTVYCKYNVSLIIPSVLFSFAFISIFLRSDYFWRWFKALFVFLWAVYFYLVVCYGYKFSNPGLSSLFIGGFLSFPWIHDGLWLLFVPKCEFKGYLKELDGIIEPSPDTPHMWERLFYWLRACNELNIPHDGVYTRLQCSKIHGVGVFAIRDIPKGTHIFSNDETDMVWIDKTDIADINPELKKLYDDFCVIENGKYGCPKNFNMLTVGWYLNESRESSNVHCTVDYDFVALRDIKKGEELTVDYSTYSESPKINKEENK
jgi:hypothetical protein